MFHKPFQPPTGEAFIFFVLLFWLKLTKMFHLDNSLIILIKHSVILIIRLNDDPAIVVMRRRQLLVSD